MAIPNTGGGTQTFDGNLSAIIMGTQIAPQTATTDATLTAAQITGGLLVGSPGTSAAAYTLPTGTALDAVMTNAKPNSTFRVTVINLGTSSGVITMTTNTGWTLVGKMTIPITSTEGSSATFLARKTTDATWTLYRVS